MTDVDRQNSRSTALEQNLGEATSGGSRVERDASGGIDTEPIEGRDQLVRIKSRNETLTGKV